MFRGNSKSDPTGQRFAWMVVAFAAVGCSGHGTCPPHGLMVNGASCHGDDLQCAHEITATGCDGNPAVVVSSCSCTNGKWDCPEPGAPVCTDGGTASSAGGAGSTGTATKPSRPSGSSCPFVYAWNGTSFEYETDLAGITIGLPPGITANAGIPLPNGGTSCSRLAHAQFDPVNGLEIHFRETVREISYLDWIRLFIVDSPVGYEVYDSGGESTNEWGYVNPQKFYTSSGARAPLAAENQDGIDVTRQLANSDNIPAPVGGDDTTLVSYALDFGVIEHPEHAKLLIDGW